MRLPRRRQLCRRRWRQGIVGQRVEVVGFGPGRLGNPGTVIVAGGSMSQSRHEDRSRDWSSLEPNQLLHRTRPSVLVCVAHWWCVVVAGIAAVPVSVLFGRSEGTGNCGCGCQAVVHAKVMIRRLELPRWLCGARQRGGWYRSRPVDDVRWPQVVGREKAVRGVWHRHRWVCIG